MSIPNRLKFKSCFLAIFLFTFWQASSQCNCDYTVKLRAEHFYADVVGVSPGEVICVEAGKREKLHFHNVKGTEDNPVIIKNCGGQVHIDGKGKGASNVPLSLNGCKYFRLTGTGDADHEYGFKLGGEAHATVEAAGRATNFEMDHIEIYASGFAGFMLKTDPEGSGRNVRPNAPDAVNGGFTMYDVNVHDCYIHDILPDGEGIYLGNSFWQTGHPKTGGQYPHNIYGAKIYNNIFDKTGREAIQAGCVVEGLEIYNNVITNYGWNNPSEGQNNGIQIGQGTSGRVYNNFINNEENEEGSRAIFVMGIGENYVYNNVIIGAGNPAGEGGSMIVNANLKKAPLPGDPGYDNGGFIGGAYFINNTIIDTKGVETVFGTYLNAAPDNVFHNNLVITTSDTWDGISGNNWTKSNNLRFRTMKEAGFVNPSGHVYDLKAGSEAVNAGADVSAYGVEVDYECKPRPMGEAFDIGAYEYDGN